MTSIYYLLTKGSPEPIGHRDAIQYSLIFPDGALKTVVLGSDIIAG